ncbi:4Fe-4S dicluster domain-containing protein [candidate division WOR-3 bacterium]|nr:4Fe-4S dicluster domain-containing protein [candidate division WOR-3 bacterium]
MKPRIIPGKELNGFIKGLMERAELYAPKERDTSPFPANPASDENPPALDAAEHSAGTPPVNGNREVSQFFRDTTEFRHITDPAQVNLDHLNTKLPLKELFLPRREVMFTFDTDTPERVEPVEAVAAERIVLGARPCDAAALEMFDRVFLDEATPDPYYRARREKTTIIGLACNEPGPACFCTAVGGSPHGSAALDLLLVDSGDRYLARPMTAKGEALVAHLPEATAPDIEKAAGLEQEARAAMKFTSDTAALQEKLKAGFDHKAWDEIALPCVNCGVCTYVCPTCHCFDVTDEESHGRGARIRTWDSCQFSLFTRHASGHNPRPTGRDRLRNRMMHKFRYFPAVHGTVLCVGCGRCIVECPSGIDLRETLTTLQEELE